MIFSIGMVLQLVLYASLILTHSLDFMIIIQFIFGMESSIRVGIGYIYLIEFFPEEKKNMIGTFWNMLEGAVYLLGTIYFWLIDKHWLPFVMIGFVMQCWVTLSVWTMPESPRYLLAT